MSKRKIRTVRSRRLYQNSQTLTHAACRPTGTSIPKTYGSPMGYRGRAQARTVPRMSQCLRSLVLEPPRVIGLDRMIARVAGELTEIGNADLGLRAQLQITAGFDERSVARDRGAQDAKRHAGVLERKQRAWRHRAKGVLPRERRARHKNHAVRHEVVAGPARAEGRIVDIGLGARVVERRHPAGFDSIVR